MSMRRLVVRLTLMASVLAGLAATALGVATNVQPHVLVFRALLAFSIVFLAGAGVGLIVMRTALRRYYEQGNARPGDRAALDDGAHTRVPTDR